MIDFSNVSELFVAGKEAHDLYINGSKVWEKSGSTPTSLTFTAEEANSTVAMQKVGSAPSVSLEYSTNGTTWNDFIVGTTTVTLTNVGDRMWMRAKTTNSAMGTETSGRNYFVMTGKIAASNSIMYLLKNDGDLDTISSSGCFRSLFSYCSSLTTAPELPATSLSRACYQAMFDGCTSLTTAPELPATSIGQLCYRDMFNGCTSLTTASELPATTLTWMGYYSMFRNCSSLTTAPELPATSLSWYCYQEMFYGCTSLTHAPELPATTLANNCYQAMFQGCTNLNEIEIAYTGNFSTTYMKDWVDGVAASGTFYYNGSDTGNFGTSAIPSGWTVQTF